MLNRSPMAVGLVCALAARAAAGVFDESNARNLHGGIFTVSFAVQTSPFSFLVFNEGATIRPGPTPNSAAARASGIFEWENQSFAWGFDFSLAGSTTTGDWTLSHTGADSRVYAVSSIIFAAPHRGGAVFDNGAEPSTPGSGPGLPNAVWRSGPAIINTDWDPGSLWSDPRNTGDLYTTALVQWAELNNHRLFGPGMTSVWRLDTDTVPAPGAALVLVGSLWRRRRRETARATG